MKTYKTIYDKIYAGASDADLETIGGYAALIPELVLGHDPLIAIMVDDFEKNGFKINKSVVNKCLFTADHFAPPASVERANILKKFLDFSFKNKITGLKIYEGICHQLMVEHSGVKPFSYIIGSDSHTCTAGALCCLAAGYGTMDILHALVRGRIYEKKFPVIKVAFKNAAPEFIDGRDIGLMLIKKIGEGCANNTALEYFDESGALAMDDRFSTACAAVETGAAGAIFAADNILVNYIAERGGAPGFNAAAIKRYYRNISFEYDGVINAGLADMTPLIAVPHDFSNIVEAGSLKKNITLDQVFIGSCASGRLLDFKRMCAIIDKLEAKKRGRIYKSAAADNSGGGIRRNKKTRLIITPASQTVFIKAMKAGYIEKLINFGAVITNPSCGPCGGIDKGILADNETCLTTATRNFKGRMGPPTSSVYISSAATAIYSAYTGIISDWKELCV
jgi:3-isopropylmalate/(R)-2-methylmalate dehydratase large subunit